MNPIGKRSEDAGRSQGEWMIEARKRAGLTEREMARKLNLAEVKYRVYEKDIVQPPPLVLHRIAHLLNINLEEIPDAGARYETTSPKRVRQLTHQSKLRFRRRSPA